MRVEAIYEERLIYEQNQTGVIFSLKNMGWKDKTETQHSGEITQRRIELVKPSHDTGK